jgi:hypothetical protein
MVLLREKSMSRLERIHPSLAWNEFVILRLFRRFAAARTWNENPMPPMIALAREIGTTAQTAISLCSAFQLSEAALGRPMIAECCCSHAQSADERALLSMFSAGSASGWQVPHGLPGALCWAIDSALLSLGGWPHTPQELDATTCPFAPSRET